MPYLIVPGAEKFIEFLKAVFGAQEQHRTNGPGDRGIMHAEVVIDGCTIMLADSSEQYRPMPAGLFIYVDNADKRYKMALDAGGKSVMEPDDMPYGRSCGVLDPFGNTWWITSV